MTENPEPAQNAFRAAQAKKDQGVYVLKCGFCRNVLKLNDERREQLKAGITASTAKKRAKIVHKNDTTDKMRSTLQSLRVLQDEQLKAAQQKLAQAGIRSKDVAVSIIFGRMVLPIALGGLAALLIYGLDVLVPDWSPIKKFGLFAAIPAVIAYNRFSAQGERLISRYYTFADEFQAILHRKVHTSED